MKAQRQAKIMEIISSINVETQEQLLQELQAAGFRSTQATISRDIKELRIVKELSALGTYRYTVATKEVPTTFSTRINTIFRECVTRYDYAQNIVVIHTLPGLAGAAASARMPILGNHAATMQRQITRDKSRFPIEYLSVIICTSYGIAGASICAGCME